MSIKLRTSRARFKNEDGSYTIGIHAVSEPEGGGDSPVRSVNGMIGDVVLSASDIGAYTKPSSGIPASDIASGVIPSDKHINDLIDAKIQSAIGPLDNIADDILQLQAKILEVL